MPESDESIVVRTENLKIKLKETDLVINFGSFSVPYGRTVLVEGPNGSGKSTFLRALANLSGDYFSILEGKLFVYEKEINERTPIEFRKSIIYVSQEDKFLSLESVYHALTRPALTAVKNIKDYKTLKKQIKELAFYYYKEFLYTFFHHRKENIERFKANPASDYKFMYFNSVTSLSGGQQKMIRILQGVIKAKVAGCNLILMDEPLNNLDVDNKRYLIKLIDDIRDNNPSLTIILITHCRLFKNVKAIIHINTAKDENVVFYEELETSVKTLNCLE